MPPMGGPQMAPMGPGGHFQPVVHTIAADSAPMVYPKSDMMTSSDMRFVVNKVIAPLDTNDPYSEDYYFLQVSVQCRCPVQSAVDVVGHADCVAVSCCYILVRAYMRTFNERWRAA